MVRPVARLAILVVLAAAATPAQRVISAKAGLVYFVQGRVSVEGSGLLRVGGPLRQLRDGETLFTERGHAQVLLNPGTVLTLGDVSRLRMDNVSLTDTRLSLQSGSAVITVTKPPKLARVELFVGRSVIVLTHPGVYRCDVSQGQLRVYDGLAELHSGAATRKTMVRHGQSIDLDGLQIAKFDVKGTDELENWAKSTTRSPFPRRFGLRPVPPRLDTRPLQGSNSADRSSGRDTSEASSFPNPNAPNQNGQPYSNPANSNPPLITLNPDR